MKIHHEKPIESMQKNQRKFSISISFCLPLSNIVLAEKKLIKYKESDTK